LALISKMKITSIKNNTLLKNKSLHDGSRGPKEELVNLEGKYKNQSQVRKYVERHIQRYNINIINK